MVGISLVPKLNKRGPMSTLQWSLAWNRFVAVLTEQQPALAPKLAQYMELIMKLAQKRGNWLFYDQEFNKTHRERGSKLGVDISGAVPTGYDSRCVQSTIQPSYLHTSYSSIFRKQAS